MLIVRPKPGKATRTYLYHLLNSTSFATYALAHTTGTTVLHLSKKAIPKFEFVCPPFELIQDFDSIISTFDNRINAARMESKELANLRDALLPILVSGTLQLNA